MASFLIGRHMLHKGHMGQVHTELMDGTVLQKKMVLVVDDELDTAITLGLVLKRMGYNVITAYDGLDGLRWAEDITPYAVLLDLGMPGMNGFELAREIRKTSWGKKVKLIAVTGHGEADDRARSAEAGFDLHMVKPVSRSSLADVLGPPEQDAAQAAPGGG
jgi:DNA-binding response OmpR family regulator